MDHIEMVLPKFGAGCITELMPMLLGEQPASLPAKFGDGGRVLLVLDGLGWEQLQSYSNLMPVLSEFVGDGITTVAPSTTACALTSITTALSPAEHGIVGCLLYTSPSPRDATLSRMPSSA